MVGSACAELARALTLQGGTGVVGAGCCRGEVRAIIQFVRAFLIVYVELWT